MTSGNLREKVQLNLRHNGKQPQRRVMADGDGDVYGNGKALMWFTYLGVDVWCGWCCWVCRGFGASRGCVKKSRQRKR